jgi:hypothetical protein
MNEIMKYSETACSIGCIHKGLCIYESKCKEITKELEDLIGCKNSDQYKFLKITVDCQYRATRGETLVR